MNLRILLFYGVSLIFISPGCGGGGGEPQDVQVDFMDTVPEVLDAADAKPEAEDVSPDVVEADTGADLLEYIEAGGDIEEDDVPADTGGDVEIGETGEVKAMKVERPQFSGGFTLMQNGENMLGIGMVNHPLGKNVEIKNGKYRLRAGFLAGIKKL